MVAGGVQSIEESGTSFFDYSPRTSFYPQFYSTLVPQQQPPTNSSTSCTCPSPSHVKAPASKHPRCTCPSPVQVVRPPTLAPSRKDPRCTCPSPPDSPWRSFSASPPVSPNLKCITTVIEHQRHGSQHPKSDKCGREKARPRKKAHSQGHSATILRYPDSNSSRGGFIRVGNDAYYVSDISNDEIRAFTKKTKEQLYHRQPKRQSNAEAPSKLRPLSASTTSLPLVVASSSQVSNGHPPSSHSEENLQTIVDKQTHVTDFSPAKKMKNKFISLKQKFISTLSRSAPSSPKYQRDQLPHEDNDGGAFCSSGVSSVENEDVKLFHENLQVMDDNTLVISLSKKSNSAVNSRNGDLTVAEKILPLPSLAYEDEPKVTGPTFSSFFKKDHNTFPIEDLPKPILDDLLSPIGSVPPLSPTSVHSPVSFSASKGQQKLILEPQVIRPRSFSVSSQCNYPMVNEQQPQSLSTLPKSNLPLKSKPQVRGYFNPPFIAPVLFRTKSLDISNTQCSNFRIEKGFGDKRLSPSGTSNPDFDYRASLRYSKPRVSPRSHRSKQALKASKASSLTNVCTKPCNCRRSSQAKRVVTESLPAVVSEGANYENVSINETNGYVRLSKKLLDRWQIPYETVSTPTLVSNHASDMMMQDGLHNLFDSRGLDNVSQPIRSARPMHKLGCNAKSLNLKEFTVKSSNEPNSSTLYQLATKHYGGILNSDLPNVIQVKCPDSRSTHIFTNKEDGDTDQETDRLLGQQRSDDPGFLEEKSWRRLKSRPAIPQESSEGLEDQSNESSPSSPTRGTSNHPPSSPLQMVPNKIKSKKDKEMGKKKGRSKEVLIEGVLFRARYLGSTQLVSEGQPTKTTRMMQAEEAVSRIKALAPEGEAQPSTEVDLFISTEKIMVLNTDLKEIMMDHALRTISYIADIGDLVVLMARRRVMPTDEQASNPAHRLPKMICHVFESDEAQFIAQSIGQAFQVAYLEFLKANGIEDHSFVKEMDYQEVLNSQEIFGDELQMFAKKELQKEVVVPKMKGEILGVVVVESGWGSMVPTVVIANLSPTGAAAKCGQLNIGDQIIAINGVSLVGLPLSNCQNYIKNTKYNTAVKLTVVPCPPVVEVKIRRPDTKYQLGFSVQNGVICSLLRGGIAERGGVRVGHRIIDINSQSVVAVPHEKIVNLLATSVGEIRMKTMPTSIFRLLTGQESPQYI